MKNDTASATPSPVDQQRAVVLEDYEMQAVTLRNDRSQYEVVIKEERLDERREAHRASPVSLIAIRSAPMNNLQRAQRGLPPGRVGV
ncbi:hypothetical protein [Gordonia pseudamarae]|uniref:hypothetical protein n=1 Tax=Gordonia pseudamarae TaxID=2831662 RepID=UPI001AFA56A6|nr:hypothetical protein [Gordonia pseudamarae]QHN28958.1 hypothetical protein GII33_23005 [Gordonia pseudamarae]